MAGPAWIVDSSRIADKIRSVSASSDPKRIKFESNPTKACPNCLFVIDNSDVAEEWPGLPLGVKFDPTDQEIIWHLCAKVGLDGFKPHPFVDHFIITVDNDDGICYTHPQNLPGVQQDGSVSHFFHRAIKAYNTGTRKRRKVQGDDFGDVRWHKTGRTKPVTLDGKHMGCKKIMVLYMNRGRSSEKTNWVMHQYHLGTGEEESDGQYVISKISYQQQNTNKGEKTEEHLSDPNDAIVVKVDPVSPKSVTPDPPRAERRCPDLDAEQKSTDNGTDRQHLEIETENLEVESGNAEYQVPPKCGDAEYNDQPQTASHDEKMVDHDNQVVDNNDDYAEDYPKWSQDILDSQQLAEGLSLCDEFFRSQSPNRDGNDVEKATGRPCLSDYAKLGAEDLKKDIEECQNLVLDPANILMDDTPPEFRLSQLEFGSQDSFLSWGVPKGD